MPGTGFGDQLLQHWQDQLRHSTPTLQLHLQTAQRHLATDPIAPLRRQALSLLQSLSQGHRPGQEEREQLAWLLRGWGDQAALNFPGLARYHYETAWSVLGEALSNPRDPLSLQPRLANLAHRQGLCSGALSLAQPETNLPPWFETPCYGLGCGDCQEQLQWYPQHCPQQQELELWELTEGRIWVERDNPWQETYGVAVTSAEGELDPAACRCYPWRWPGCRHAEAVQRLAVQQLAWRLRQQDPPQRLNGPVLAVADLSAELYYHFQLELLPRLGLAWQQLSRQEPHLRLWHNGGNSPRVQEALTRLGIPKERVLNATQIPHLQAERLWLANWPSPFGAPGPWVVAWLRELYGVTPPLRASGDLVLWLPRGSAPRRPLLQEEAWIFALGARLAKQGLQLVRAKASGSVRRQLQQLGQARAVVAPHGGAMVNLLAAAGQTPVLELVNPAYAPPYFASVIASANLHRHALAGQSTAEPLSRLLYSGPLEWPIELGSPLQDLPVLHDALMQQLDHG